MRRVLIFLVLLGLLAVTAPAAEISGKVKKVLPHFLDLKGHHTVSPSLYDRDAYQAFLRQNPDKRSAIRFNILWKAWAPKGTPLKLRVEVRGDAPGKTPFQKTLEQDFVMGSSKSTRWTSLLLTGEDYKNLGDLTAWRATLWNGDQMIAEQKSFLW